METLDQWMARARNIRVVLLDGKLNIVVDVTLGLGWVLGAKEVPWSVLDRGMVSGW